MYPEGEPMTGVMLASSLVKQYAPTLRFTMAETGDDWQEGITSVVESAVRTAHGFVTNAEARVFIRTLLEGIE